MGWQEREYERRVNYGGNPFTNPILKLIFGSVYIGTIARIRIRVHASLLWYMGLTTAFAGHGWEQAATASIALFGIILLHEFGHCFACRWVGGQANDILMWMLGGLAFADPPRRPWTTFVTVAGGPMVNVVIGLILGSVIAFGYHVIPPLNPLYTFVPGVLTDYISKHPDALWKMFDTRLGTWLFWIYSTNLSILFFNLIPMYPLDGGQMLHTILWKPMGYMRSMKIVCYIGLVLASTMAIYGIFAAPFLLFISLFSIMGCVQQLRMVREASVQDEEPYDLSAAWNNSDSSPKTKKKRKKNWLSRARKRALADQAEQAKIDAILAKVKDKGLHSLSWWEKRTLKKATQRQRQHDVASRL